MILPVSLKSPIIISDSLATQKLYNFLLISACCVHWIKRPKAFRYFAIAHTSWVAACERIAIFNDLLGVICVMRQNIEMEKLFRQLTERRIPPWQEIFSSKKSAKKIFKNSKTTKLNFRNEISHLRIFYESINIWPTFFVCKIFISTWPMVHLSKEENREDPIKWANSSAQKPMKICTMCVLST